MKLKPIKQWRHRWVTFWSAVVAAPICLPLIRYATIPPTPWPECFRMVGLMVLVTAPMFWLVGWLADSANAAQHREWERRRACLTTANTNGTRTRKEPSA